MDIRDVHAGYGPRSVLNGVSLVARPGEVTGLIGPNGSGKTTLVRVASRGLAPRRGSVRVAGADPYTLSSKEAARLVGVVPQELAPAFDYTVLEVVLMGRSPYRAGWSGHGSDDWAQARRAMAAASVLHLADRPIGELSGGERQRAVLAQALAQDTPVLLLDEPTTHLDIRHMVEILGLVRGLARAEGKAILAIFHDLNLASSYCDVIFALAEGQVVTSGSPVEVITADLVRDVFGLEADVSPAGAAGRPSVVVSPPVARERTLIGDAPRAHVVGGAGRGAAAIRGLAERGLDVSVGVLHGGDTDAAVAERLNLLRVTVPPFSSIDRRSAEDTQELMRRASVVIVCDAPFGPGNVENLHLALRAARAGVRIMVLEQVPIEERDFTGGEATVLWHELVRHARVFDSVDSLLRAVTVGSVSAAGEV
jgi:iron complex transport system ATP-binding protein